MNKISTQHNELEPSEPRRVGDDRRDLAGYGRKQPDAPWPNSARLAVSVVVNVEEGAELSIADGDSRNESIHEIREEVLGAADPCMESHFGYGPRAGYWRIVDLLDKYGVGATFSSCGRAAERTPWLLRDAVSRGHEASCHSWLWQSHAGLDEETERAVIARTHQAVGNAAGVAPVGWHTRSASTLATRRLLVEHGGFLYDSDAYDDDIPYQLAVADKQHLVMPYAFDTNDMRFQPGGGFIQAKDFSEYCLGAFDCLLGEGERAARLMSIGLHLRIIGRPGRIGGLETVLKALSSTPGVWLATRADIARCWLDRPK
ncbi:MAG: polysaccharide deacetylase family protein [Burkholderiaceae bacterium]